MEVMQLKSKNMPDPNDLIFENRYDEAITVCKKALRLLPRNAFIRHWYLIHLSSAYYEKKNYKRALWWAEKAIKKNPKCPTCLWHYAGPLLRLGHVRKAIKCYKSIYDRGLNELAYGECGEGRNLAGLLRSDVRIRLAIAHYMIDDLKNAVKWGRLFLRYFHKDGGAKQRRFGEKLLKRYQKEIGQ